MFRWDKKEDEQELTILACIKVSRKTCPLKGMELNWVSIKELTKLEYDTGRSKINALLQSWTGVQRYQELVEDWILGQQTSPKPRPKSMKKGEEIISTLLDIDLDSATLSHDGGFFPKRA